MSQALMRLILAPRTWAYVYVVLIPLYATAYDRLPGGSFYDSNVRHERAFAEDGERLRASLAAQIGAETTLSWRDGGHTWHMLTGLLRVGSLANHPFEEFVFPGTIGNHVQPFFGTQSSFSETQSSFFETPGFLMEVGGLARTMNPENVSDEGFDFFVLAWHPMAYACRVREGDRVVSKEFVHYDVIYANRKGKMSEGPGPHSFPPVSVLFPQGGACGSGLSYRLTASDAGSLMLPVELGRQTYRFFAAETGDPTDASNLWLRMFYLSATTITTLGLGDITPVSTIARILVGLEAVMGILVVGLFLNALARRWSRSRA